MTGFCEFKTQAPSKEWQFLPYESPLPGYGNGFGRKMRAPQYGAGQDGIAPEERAIKRCPLCGKRLRLRANYCVGGEFVAWELPEHKARVTRKPGPRRSSRKSGRGK